MADSIPSELDQLRRENARLIGLLESHGIAWRATAHAPTETAEAEATALANSPLSTRKKVALFRRLFRGRDDVDALRWQSNNSGRSGYAPACANEWRPGLPPQALQPECSMGAGAQLLVLNAQSPEAGERGTWQR